MSNLKYDYIYVGNEFRGLKNKPCVLMGAKTASDHILVDFGQGVFRQVPGHTLIKRVKENRDG